MYKKLPDNLTIEVVMEACERQMFGTDNPGFCLSCGEEADGCEPDASEYECEVCGEHAVMGAEEVMLVYS